MANSDTQTAAASEAWRPGGICAAHIAFGFSVLVCLAMSIITLSL